MASQSGRCVNCSITVRSPLTSHSLDELSNSMLNVLSSWIRPNSITNGGILCHECFVLLPSTETLRDIPTPRYGHEHVCFGCGKSILRSRTNRVSLQCPERDIILRWTPAHQVSRLSRVCAACWRAANRQVQRQHLHDEGRQEIEIASGPSSPVPVPSPLPPLSVNPLQSQHLHDEEGQQLQPEIETASGPSSPVPEPPPLPPLPVNLPSRAVLPKIHSRIYKRAPATSNACVFSGCRQPERLLVPRIIREMVLKHNKFYIPTTSRICRHHLDNGIWSELTSNLQDFTGAQFDMILDMMNRAASYTLDFNNIISMAPHLCHYWLGMNAEKFQELLVCVPSLTQSVRYPSLALCIYIVKLRTGDSNERLSTLFNLPRSTLERKMKIARNCLIEEFVPRNLGFDHMNVEQVATRNKIIPEGLFGNPILPNDVKPAIVMCDATYIYVQSSSNYRFQKETYSLQKLDNLVKPFMIVCCDGYILDCMGPYKATINDANITRNDLINEEGKLRTFFRQNDVFILDRGFRDVMGLLEELGFKAYMPESLIEGEHQLTTLQANKSRFVTMCRWVVEIVNGRIKRDFKLFRNVFNNRAIPHLKDDFKIACALLNKFHPLILDPPEARDYVAIAQSRLHETNHLAAFIERENVNRRRATFSSIDSNHPHLNTFPRLTIEELKRFALGTYQLKQARSYFGEHVRSSGTYSIEINDEIDEDVPLVLGLNNYLLRGRIKSRHVGGRTYFVYLLISNETSFANTLRAIVGYCCNCLVGKRTVGCCAHVMTIVWFLSWGRFNDVRAPAPFLDDIFDDEI